MNECMPKYEPGQDITGHVTQAGGVVGKRLLAISGDKQGVEAVSDGTTGGNIQVAYPAAGARTVGVSGFDCAQNKKVKVVRGKGKVVPILAAANMAVDTEVEPDATGRVVAFGTAVGGRAAGRLFRAAVNGQDALVELY